jgi:lipoprotein NlpD
MMPRACCVPVAAALAAAVALAGLAGCVAPRGAPVVDRSPQAKTPPPTPSTRPVAGYYTVRKGDTLYSIALDHGIDYRELAQWNGITDPAMIRVGQQLRVTAPGSPATASAFKTAPGLTGRPIGGTPAPGGNVKSQPKAVRAPYSEQTYAQMASLKPDPAPKPDARPPAGQDGDETVPWGWPAAGRMISGFNESANLKGIAIAGKLGQPVLASAPGRVIFSGTGIRGFGKLIVIKHNNTFLSVYAHNNELLVKEGQSVTKGQKIAEMGSTDTDQVKLHFEIRRYGKPVDPVKLLPPA